MNKNYEDLPEEILEQVLAELAPREKVALSKSSKRLREVVRRIGFPEFLIDTYEKIQECSSLLESGFRIRRIIIKPIRFVTSLSVLIKLRQACKNFLESTGDIMREYFDIPRECFEYVEITISDDGFGDEILLELKGVPEIYIFAKYSEITNEGLKYNPNILGINVPPTEYVNGEGLQYLTKALKVGLSDCDYIANEDLAYLSGAHELDLSSTHISGKGFKYLSNVHTLNISNVDINIGDDDDDDEYFENLSRVNTLNLSSTYVRDKSMRFLKDVYNLDISDTYVTDEGLKYLSRVRILNLMGTEITDEGLRYLSEVHTLNLSGTAITDEGLRYLTNVHTLNLSDTRITSRGFEYLRNLSVVILDERFREAPPEILAPLSNAFIDFD